MREPLSPQYDPGAIETPLYRLWEARGYFQARAGAVRAGRADPYVIVIPPPNVTAVLHMGHGLNNTIQDVLTRWQRMRGREALYLPGTDHAGIATQNVVERIVAAEGRTRAELGREAFVERVWQFVDETGPTILQQLRAIGCSCDWSRTRFTLEPALSRAVREVFVQLYEKGLIYRGNYIINWCPRCLTALSDEEAEGEPTQGRLYHLRYPLADPAPGLPTLPDGRAYVVVATTRPETMLGDTAVAVHPDDERYRALVGRDVLLPLAERRIPIVADAFVDREFGTGAVKITPAHDPNDFEMARRHGIAPLDIMTPEAHLNDAVPEPFRGLERFAARKAVVEAFRAAGLLEKIDDHAHTLPHCYRCDTIVEPRLSDQWFVRMAPLAAPALAAARAGQVRFTPERHARVYEHWLENIRDWCISRQLWWGHRIPVFYCGTEGCGAMIVAREDPTSCPECGGGALTQDPDVLDTWFSSWLWPFSTLGWPDETEDLAAFYPSHTLVTAPEILFFWVARMIMAGLEFRDRVPFQDVYLTGTVRDMEGRKMSKSLGNGIDPLEVVKLYGADALRYTVISSVGLGTDVRMDPNDLETTFSVGRNFSNKVWNAGRFALMNVAADEVAPVAAVAPSLELADRWILSRLGVAAQEIGRNLETFRFHEAAESAYHFFWGELADWYLEVIKPRVQPGAAPVSRAAAETTLVATLDGILRLLHPVMPFITEALWQRLPRVSGAARSESIMIAAWPEAADYPRDADAEAQFGELMDLIGTVRALRSEYGIAPATPVALILSNVSAALEAALAREEHALRRLARVGEIRHGSQDGGAGAHAVLPSGVEVFLPLAGVIDLDRERERLARELERLDGQLRGTVAKLANEQFTARAPADVVAREREKADSYREQRDRLATKLAGLS
ncbi:MAG TPA: valine--tRNA ligase [Longimicrobiales bacterium]|nr:valine--tRNA ligase [Longimicrobiales bacterium]